MVKIVTLIVALVSLNCHGMGGLLPKSYKLTVNNGTGSGAYKKGTVVNISANVGERQVFIEWTGCIKYVFNPNIADTTYTMGGSDCSVTAVVEQGPTDPCETDPNSIECRACVPDDPRPACAGPEGDLALILSMKCYHGRCVKKDAKYHDYLKSLDYHDKENYLWFEWGSEGTGDKTRVSVINQQPDGSWAGCSFDGIAKGNKKKYLENIRPGEYCEPFHWEPSRKTGFFFQEEDGLGYGRIFWVN